MSHCLQERPYTMKRYCDSCQLLLDECERFDFDEICEGKVERATERVRKESYMERDFYMESSL